MIHTQNNFGLAAMLIVPVINKNKLINDTKDYANDTLNKIISYKTKKVLPF